MIALVIRNKNFRTGSDITADTSARIDTPPAFRGGKGE